MANRLFDSLFDEAEEGYGLPAGYLRPTVIIESGLNPRARAPTSSAGGLFQHLDSTARQYGLTNKFDPAASTDAAARLTRDNAAALERRLGRPATREELYAAHLAGAPRAATMIMNPDAPAHSVMGMNAVRINGGDDAMTSGDFLGKHMSKFQRAAGVPQDTTGGYQTDGAQAAWQARQPQAMGGGGSDDTMAGGSGSDTLRPQQPQGPTLANNVGGWIGALGLSLMSSPRNAPFQNMPQALQNQQANQLRQQEARARQAATEYGYTRDEKQDAFQERSFAATNAERLKESARQDREEARKEEAAKLPRVYGPADNPYIVEGGKVKPLLGDGGSKPPVTKTIKRDGVDVEVQWEPASRQWVPLNAPSVPGTPGGSSSPLPAEMAGRLGMADEFFRRYDVIRPKIAEGAITGPIEGPWARNNVGAPGALMSDLKVGSEALFRMLTGAGSGKDEARSQADQYLPSMTDTKEKALDKADRLRDVLRSTQRSALAGRMPQAEIDKKFPSFEGSGTNRYNEKPGQSSASPPAGAPPGARQGNDGNYYVPDPSRPGKFLRVEQ